MHQRLRFLAACVVRLKAACAPADKFEYLIDGRDGQRADDHDAGAQRQALEVVGAVGHGVGAGNRAGGVQVGTVAPVGKRGETLSQSSYNQSVMSCWLMPNDTVHVSM